MLLGCSFKHSFTPVRTGVGARSRGSNGLVVGQGSVRGRVGGRLVTAASLLDFRPRRVSTTCDGHVGGRVPTMFRKIIRAGTNFGISNSVSVAPHDVGICTDSIILSALGRVGAVCARVGGKGGAIAHAIRLRGVSKIALRPADMAIAVPVRRCARGALRVPIVYAGLPPRCALHVFPTIIGIDYGIPLSHFGSISTSSFRVQVSFTSLRRDTSKALPLRLGGGLD